MVFRGYRKLLCLWHGHTSRRTLTVAEVDNALRGCKLHSIWPLLRFLHAQVRVEIDAYADLTCQRSICLNVNDPCRETILGCWLPAQLFGNCDEYLHKLAHLWRNVRRKVGSQHGDIYCLASPSGTGLSAGSKPQWDLEVHASKETALGLPQASSRLPSRGDAVLEWPFFRKTGTRKDIPYCEVNDYEYDYEY